MMPASRPRAMVRRLTWLLAAVSLALLVAGIGPVARVYACSCAMMGPAEALANADAAFVGVVAAVHDPSAGNPMISSADPIRYTFAVEEALTPGVEVGALVLSSARDGASCGMTFAVAQRWRVYAYRDGAGLSTGICSGNELLAERAPIPTISAPPGTLPPVGVFVAVGAALAVAAVSAWAFTRRGRVGA